MISQNVSRETQKKDAPNMMHRHKIDYRLYFLKRMVG